MLTSLAIPCLIPPDSNELSDSFNYLFIEPIQRAGQWVRCEGEGSTGKTQPCPLNDVQ